MFQIEYTAGRKIRCEVLEDFYYNRKSNNYGSDSVAFYNYYIGCTDKNIAE